MMQMKEMLRVAHFGGGKIANGASKKCFGRIFLESGNKIYFFRAMSEFGNGFLKSVSIRAEKLFLTLPFVNRYLIFPRKNLLKRKRLFSVWKIIFEAKKNPHFSHWKFLGSAFWGFALSGRFALYRRSDLLKFKNNMNSNCYFFRAGEFDYCNVQLNLQFKNLFMVIIFKISVKYRCKSIETLFAHMW